MAQTKVQFKNLDNSKVYTTNAKLGAISDQNKRLVFIYSKIDFEQNISPKAKVYSVESDNSLKEIKFKVNSAKSIAVLLISLTGKLVVKDSGFQKNFEYKVIAKNSGYDFIVDTSCKSIDLKIKLEESKAGYFPAMISCQFEKDKLVSVVFSTIDDSEWLGSNLSISSGKGERWKEFAASELINEKKAEIQWGLANSKSKIKFFIKKQAVANNNTKLWKLKTGLQLGAAQYSRTGYEVLSMNALYIPVWFDYKSASLPLVVKARSSILLKSMDSADSASTSNSKLDVGVGYNYKRDTYNFSLGGLYYIESLQLPKLNVGSNINSPGLFAQIDFNKLKWSPQFNLRYFSSSSGGNFSRTNAELFIYPGSITSFESFMVFGYESSHFEAGSTELSSTAYMLSAGVQF